MLMRWWYSTFRMGCKVMRFRVKPGSAVFAQQPLRLRDGGVGTRTRGSEPGSSLVIPAYWHYCYPLRPALPVLPTYSVPTPVYLLLLPSIPPILWPLLCVCASDCVHVVHAPGAALPADCRFRLGVQAPPTSRLPRGRGGWGLRGAGCGSRRCFRF
jgi:hypothetical protein